MDKHLEYYKQRAINYELLYREQKSICDEYRELCNNYSKEIKEKDMQISMLLNERNTKVALGKHDFPTSTKSTQFPE